MTSALVLGACTGASAPPAQVSNSSESAPSPVSESARPQKFSSAAVTQTVGGFSRPWDLRLLPDGTPLVSERPGQVSVIVDGSRRVVDTVQDVVAAGEGGLMGLALDPKFATNRRIYVCHASGSAGRVTDVRVVRFRLAKSLDRLTRRTPVITGIPAGAGNRHLGCRIDFGPDEMLWVTTGDAVIPSAPQDLASKAGKVLRALPGGDPAADNPDLGADPYVYTFGHRNIQGLAFRPTDGTPVTVEHGTNCDDEINVLTAGGNYGWDPDDGGRYAEGAPMTSPDIRGALSAVWSSGCPSIAPSGADFIAGEAWGKWDGALAVAVLKDQKLLLVTLEGDEIVATRNLLSGTLGRLRTVRPGAQSSIWLTVDADEGSVVNVAPEG